MLTTIYKDESGKIVSLHLHAQDEDDREQLGKDAEHFSKEDAVEPEPEPELASEPEVMPDEDPQPVHENTTVQ